MNILFYWNSGFFVAFFHILDDCFILTKNKLTEDGKSLFYLVIPNYLENL